MVARDKMTGPSTALTAKPASSHSSQGTDAAKWPAPVSAGGKTDPCPNTHGRSITWDVWRTQRAFALQFGIPYRTRTHTHRCRSVSRPGDFLGGRKSAA